MRLLDELPHQLKRVSVRFAVPLDATACLMMQLNHYNLSGLVANKIAVFIILYECEANEGDDADGESR